MPKIHPWWIPDLRCSNPNFRAFRGGLVHGRCRCRSIRARHWHHHSTSYPTSLLPRAVCPLRTTICCCGGGRVRCRRLSRRRQLFSCPRLRRAFPRPARSTTRAARIHRREGSTTLAYSHSTTCRCACPAATTTTFGHPSPSPPSSAHLPTTPPTPGSPTGCCRSLGQLALRSVCRWLGTVEISGIVESLKRSTLCPG